MHFVIVSLDDPSCVSSASLEQFYEALFLESLCLVPLCSHVYIAERPTERFLKWCCNRNRLGLPQLESHPCGDHIKFLSLVEKSWKQDDFLRHEEMISWCTFNQKINRLNYLEPKKLTLRALDCDMFLKHYFQQKQLKIWNTYKKPQTTYHRVTLFWNKCFKKLLGIIETPQRSPPVQETVYSQGKMKRLRQGNVLS